MEMAAAGQDEQKFVTLRPNNINYILVALIGLVLFVPFLGQVHLFDWDEINFAESAREMILTGDYFRVQVNFLPFWEKPPLFFWLQVLSMKIFGVNEFAARLPNAIAGVATLLLIFHIGRKYFSQRIAWLWVLCYLGAFTPHLYFKSGIIDPVFNLFIFSGVYFLFKAKLTAIKAVKFYIIAGICLGLAVLTKGPAAVLITLLTIVTVWVWNKFRFWFSFKQLLVYVLFAILVSFLWFGMETIEHGFFFLREFIAYQIDLFLNPVASHGQPFYYHTVVLLIGCFPVSIFALLLVRRFHHDNIQEKEFTSWMAILFFVVLILFSIVKTKIVHYSSMCYLPLTFLAALAIDKLIEGNVKWKKFLYFFIFIIGTLLVAALLIIPLAGINEGLKQQIIPYIQDPFAVANFSLPVRWETSDLLPGIILLLSLIFAIISFARKQHAKASIAILFGVLLTLQLAMVTIVPKIEQHSQGAAIEFWEQQAEKDVYIQPLGYDTYAHYFYAKVQKPNRLPPAFETYLAAHADEVNQSSNPSETRNRLFTSWLLEEDVDKPVYFCCHMAKAAEFEQKYNLQRIGEKGGFVFFQKGFKRRVGMFLK